MDVAIDPSQAHLKPQCLPHSGQSQATTPASGAEGSAHCPVANVILECCDVLSASRPKRQAVITIMLHLSGDPDTRSGTRQVSAGRMTPGIVAVLLQVRPGGVSTAFSPEPRLGPEERSVSVGEVMILPHGEHDVHSWSLAHPVETFLCNSPVTCSAPRAPKLPIGFN
jgi:hypothetical protein